MITASKQAALPAIRIDSNPFADGWNTAMSDEHNGWPKNKPPTEPAIVQFLQDANNILDADGWPTYETHWIAGLLAGWLRRSEFRA